tara:strand:- start:374 stop:547 length:174 start_codon:yes stop_codon:yes gene_type:complete
MQMHLSAIFGLGTRKRILGQTSHNQTQGTNFYGEGMLLTQGIHQQINTTPKQHGKLY